MKNYQLGKIPSTILYAGFTLVSLLLVYISLTLVEAPAEQRFYIYSQAEIMLEYAMMCLVIIVGGALYYDAVIKSSQREKKSR